MYSLRSVNSKTLCWYTLKRHFGSKEVRVRFAPSPTGFLHLGGLRTALYNYLFARHEHGKFLLRIEDTDQTRLVPNATESLIEDLLWAGIEIDEGPGKFGGPHGPYVQSERTAIYTDAVQQLLENGSAYRCFCTEHRLDLLRREALRMRQIPRYDNKCRHLTPEKTNELLAKQSPFCVRFKLIDHTEPLNDLIYGRVQHNVSDTEGDPIIMKTDQFPTYHLANVVDDHLMGVTHVFRGVEWQISTTKHLLLYKAFGWQAPQFGHLPLLVNADGTKLSKRQGDIGIKHFRDKGYYPNAIVNYVTSAGGGFIREPTSKLQIYGMSALAEQFDIKRVNSHPSRLNPELLDEFNRLEIIRLLASKSTTAELVKHVQTLVKQSYPNEDNLDLEASHIENILHWSTQRVTFIKDLTSPQLSFLWLKPTNFVLEDMTTDQLKALMQRLANADFTRDGLNRLLREFAQSHNIKFALFMKTLRSALSGLKEGPGVAEMMDILGKEVVLQRLGNVVENKNTTNHKEKLVEN